VVIVVPAALFIAAPAQAQDRTPAEIEAQIDEAWLELEPVIEEHNAVRSDLKQRKAAVKKLASKIEPLELKVDVARAEIAELAIYSFKGGNMSALRALLTTGSPLTLAEQLSVLDQFAKAQGAKIANVLQTKADFETRKAELDGLVSELAEMEKKLAERADEIDAEIDRLQELRTEAYGDAGEAAVVGDLAPAACPATYPGGAAGEAVSFACAQIGKPYGWGEAGPDAYDCSGLTMVAWQQGGVSLPHNSAAQRDAIGYVDRSDLRPGDLVFYYSGLSHVGMYVGGGWIVHASRAGEPVHMSPVDQSPIHSYGRP
jgi:cell wall-associated NlpC family hydrolase